MYGAQPEQKRELHQPGAELDVVFDLISNVLILRETIKDPERKKAAWTLSVLVDCSKMHFINLRGLKDGSLQLSLQMKRSACFAKGDRMLIEERFNGYAPLHLESRLFADFYSCDWSKQRIELFLPKERIRGWKTVALILKTFKEITAAHWCHMVNIIKPPPVNVLDWRGLVEYLRVVESKKEKETVKVNKLHVALEDNNTANPMHQDSKASLEKSHLVLVSTVAC